MATKFDNLCSIFDENGRNVGSCLWFKSKQLSHLYDDFKFNNIFEKVLKSPFWICKLGACRIFHCYEIWQFVKKYKVLLRKLLETHIKWPIMSIICFLNHKMRPKPIIIKKISWIQICNSLALHRKCTILL